MSTTAKTPAKKTEPKAQEQPSDQPVQHVMTEKSLKGLSGWLAVWLVIFILAAIGGISAFFTTLASEDFTASDVNLLLFMPLMVTGCIVSAVFMTEQKRLAQYAALATLGVSAAYSVINMIITHVTDVVGDEPVAILVSNIMVSLLLHIMMALYFIRSKRVKETLVND